MDICSIARRTKTVRSDSGSRPIAASVRARSSARAAIASGSMAGGSCSGGPWSPIVEAHHGAPSAQPAQRFVDRNPREPGRNAGLCAEMLDRGECEYISLLHRVLGFVLVLKDAARDSEQPLVTPAHQLPARSGITVAATSKERSVR